MRASTRKSIFDVFRWPLVLWLCTLIGLISGLLDNGIADGVSWLLLASLIGVMVMAWIKPAK